MEQDAYIIPGREASGRELLPGIGIRERPYIYVAAAVAFVALAILLPLAGIPAAFGTAAFILFAVWIVVTKQSGTSILEFARRMRAFSARPKRYHYKSREI
ncbi:MAG: hypothetical protein Q7J82_06640 [Coriobacteriia bacterium]|nr:hypothetical protein [Coriobacteriia bacterium]